MFLRPMLIGALVGAVIGGAPGFLLAWLFYRRRQRVYRELRAQFSEPVADEQVCNVRYASAKRLKSPWKFFPWEMIGILVVDQDGLTAHLQTANGKRHETFRFVPDRDVVDWRGTESVMRNGLLNWVAIGEPENPQHYFTAETGITILGSKDRSPSDCAHVAGVAAYEALPAMRI